MDVDRRFLRQQFLGGSSPMRLPCKAGENNQGKLLEKLKTTPVHQSVTEH